MGSMNLTIDDKLEKEFREVAYRQKGMKKGFLTGATEEAIKVWLGYVKLKHMSKDDKLWPEEEKELEDIMEGRVKMVTQTGEEFLKELEAVIKTNERLED
jgi:hypothetical protein